jgi:predicted nucleic acid-binding protein
LKAVCDSSPLIGLHAINRLELLPVLFHEVMIPPAVAHEIQSFALPSWARIVPLPAASLIVPNGLGAGESDAIRLAHHLNETIVLDDEAARRFARASGLNVIGVLGLLLSAKQRGIIESVRKEMDALADASFHISPRVYRDLLRSAGEI